MKFQIMTVRDRAADIYGVPFFAVSIGAAIRSFTDEINNTREGNTLNKHPDDFDLYYVGLYHDSDGQFETTAPRQIAVGKELKEQTDAQK